MSEIRQRVVWTTTDGSDHADETRAAQHQDLIDLREALMVDSPAPQDRQPITSSSYAIAAHIMAHKPEFGRRIIKMAKEFKE